MIRRTFDVLGYELVRKSGPVSYPPDIDPRSSEIVQEVEPFTLTSPERIFALCEAVRYIVQAGVPGSIVECGVWRGGSIMAAIRTLQSLHHWDRDLYLYDTFDGMTEPTIRDVDLEGVSASTRVEREGLRRRDGKVAWVDVSLEEVRERVLATGYPGSLVHFVPGPVEVTLPGEAPSEIALLRLDTDWYESTRHELEHLFPRLMPGGVIIIDDYGHWRGAREAVDEYFASNNVDILLNRIDYTGRIGVFSGAANKIGAANVDGDTSSPHIGDPSGSPFSPE